MSAILQPQSEPFQQRRRALARNATSLPSVYDSEWDGTVFFHHSGGLPERYEVGHYAQPDQKQILYWLAHLVAANTTTGARGSAITTIQAVRALMRFLQEAAPSVMAPQDFTPVVMRRFSAWIRMKKEWQHDYQGMVFNSVCRLFRQLRLLRPALVCRDLSTATFGKRAHRPPAISTLTLEDGAAIEKACMIAADAYLTRFRSALRLMEEAQLSGIDPEADAKWSESVGVLLLKVRHQMRAGRWGVNNPKYDRIHAMLERGRHRHSELPLAHISDANDVLMPGLSSMFPFFLLIVSRLGGNTSSMTDIACDCLVPPPAAEIAAAPGAARGSDGNTIEYVTWFKQRVRQVHVLPCESRAPHHAPAMIRRVLEITQEVRRAADPETAKYLFSYRWTAKMSRPAHHFDHHSVAHGMKLFRRAHPALPHFTLPQLRKRFADAALVSARGNIVSAAAVMHHRSAATMHRHYKGSAGKMELDIILSKFGFYFQRLIEMARPDKPLHAQLHVGVQLRPVLSASNLADSPLVSAGFQFAAAFENGGLVINAGDAECWARILQFSAHIRNQRRPENALRWEAALGPIDRFLHGEILPHMPAQVTTAAHAMAQCLPDLPHFE